MGAVISLPGSATFLSSLQGVVPPAVADEEVELELLRRRQQSAGGVA
jgi:hypothetical protein